MIVKIIKYLKLGNIEKFIKHPKGRDKGITLIELFIGISLSILIIFAAGAIWISGWNMFRNAQFIAQTQRNAMVPMAHMAKNLQRATVFTPVGATELRFTVNPLGTSPTDIRRYIFQSNQILYDTDTVAGGEQIIGIHIPTAQNANPFTISHGGIVVNIRITADDNLDQNLNLYTTTSAVEAKYGATPPV